jgi:cyclic pyranopterin phosphate synthase
MSRLTHVDQHGRASMVDVGGKDVTPREAVALGELRMAPATVALVQHGGLPKGDVLAVARVAGVMAAKRTPELIPLCHSLPLDAVEVRFRFLADRIRIKATARCTGRTGVEMEALTAATVAGLTLYDMCKAVDKQMEIGGVLLARKTGGRHGLFERTEFAAEIDETWS